MADKGLSVNITADVTSLQAKAAIAKAEYAALSASVRSLAKDYTTATEETKTALSAQLQAAVAAAEGEKAALAGLQAEIAKSNGKVEESKGLLADLGESVRVTGESFENLHARISVFSDAIGKFSEFVFAGLAIDQVSEAINRVAETGEGLEKLSEETGLTTEQLSGLRVLALETGTDFEQFTTLIQKLPNTLQEAATGNGKAADAFRAMGVQVTNAHGQIRPMGDILDDVSAKLASYADGANKTALETDIFGAKIGANLIPMLNELGQVGIAGTVAQSDNLNQTWNGPSAQAASKYEDDMHRAKIAVDGLGDSIARLAMKPEDWLARQIGPSLDYQISKTEGQLEVLNGRGLAMKGILEARLRDLQNEQAQINASVGQQNATAGGAAPGTVQAPSLSGNVSVGGHQGAGGSDPALQGMNSDSSGVTSDGGGDGGVSAAKSAQDQITQIAQDAAQARKQIATSEYEAQVSNWTAEVAQGKLSKAAEIQDEIAAKNQIYQADLSEAQKEAALDPSGTAAKAKALDDIQVLTAQHNAEIAQLNADLVDEQIAQAKAIEEAQKQAAEEAQQAWQKVVQPIETSMDGMLNGILQGTQTLRGAEIKAAQDVTLAFIDAEAKKALSFAASEAQILAKNASTQLGMTAAVVAGNRAQIADTETANAQKNSINIIQTAKTVLGNAGQAASGAFAAMAGIPIVGPELGAAAAATTFTAVLAYDVLSAEGGLALGPGMNPLVQLHENEMVLPAHIATPLQAMLGGDTFNQSGGDTNTTNHFNVTANSSGGGDITSQVYEAMNKAARNGGFPAQYSALNRMMRRGN